MLPIVVESMTDATGGRRWHCGRYGRAPTLRRDPIVRSAVVDELDRDVQVRLLEQRLHGLQVVAALAGHPQLLAGDLALHRLGALLADDLRDLLGVLLVEALLQGRLDPVLLAG